MFNRIVSIPGLPHVSLFSQEWNPIKFPEWQSYFDGVSALQNEISDIVDKKHADVDRAMRQAYLKHMENEGDEVSEEASAELRERLTTPREDVQEEFHRLKALEFAENLGGVEFLSRQPMSKIFDLLREEGDLAEEEDPKYWNADGSLSLPEKEDDIANSFGGNSLLNPRVQKDVLDGFKNHATPDEVIKFEDIEPSWDEEGRLDAEKLYNLSGLSEEDVEMDKDGIYLFSNIRWMLLYTKFCDENDIIPTESGLPRFIEEYKVHQKDEKAEKDMYDRNMRNNRGKSNVGPGAFTPDYQKFQKSVKDFITKFKDEAEADRKLFEKNK